MTTLFAS